MQSGRESSQPAPAWRSRDYVLKPAQRLLLHHGEPVHVEERVFDLLVLLLRHHHRALQQREIISALWGNRPVSDATLRQLVYKARRVLGDDGEHQATIRTLYGRSLQWVGPVEELVDEYEDGLPQGSGLQGRSGPVESTVAGSVAAEAETQPSRQRAGKCAGAVCRATGCPG